MAALSQRWEFHIPTAARKSTRWLLPTSTKAVLILSTREDWWWWGFEGQPGFELRPFQLEARYRYISVCILSDDDDGWNISTARLRTQFGKKRSKEEKKNWERTGEMPSTTIGISWNMGSSGSACRCREVVEKLCVLFITGRTRGVGGGRAYHRIPCALGSTIYITYAIKVGSRGQCSGNPLLLCSYMLARSVLPTFTGSTLTAVIKYSQIVPATWQA